MKIIALVAVAQNGVIGKNNDLPWKLKSDLLHFKNTTLGHPILMGRKNFESIGRALPKRTNIILTRNTDFQFENCVVLNSIPQALEFCTQNHAEKAFIIGGGEIYNQGLKYCHQIIYTRVLAEVEGDVYFPEINWNEWSKTSVSHHEQDENNQYPFDIEIWDRIQEIQK